VWWIKFFLDGTTDFGKIGDSALISVSNIYNGFKVYNFDKELDLILPYSGIESHLA
jgi:hypothetical protein